MQIIPISDFKLDCRKNVVFNNIIYCVHSANIQAFDIFKNKVLFTINGNTNILSIGISPDGKYLLTGSDICRLYDLSTRTVVAVFNNYQGNAECIGIYSNNDNDNDNYYIFTSSQDFTIKLYIVNKNVLKIGLLTSLPTRSLKGHKKTITSIIYNEKTKQLVSADKDCKIICWDIECFEPTQYYNVLSGHSDYIYGQCFINSRLLASCSVDKTIKIWDLKTQSCIKTLFNEYDEIYNIVAAPDGIHILTCAQSIFINVWNIHTGKCVYKYQIKDVGQGYINTIRLSDDGGFIFCNGLKVENFFNQWNYKLYVLSVIPKFPTLVKETCLPAVDLPAVDLPLPAVDLRLPAVEIYNYKLFSNGNLVFFQDEKEKTILLQNLNYQSCLLIDDNRFELRFDNEILRFDNEILRFDNEILIFYTETNSKHWIETIKSIIYYLKNNDHDTSFSAKNIILYYRFDILQKFCGKNSCENTHQNLSKCILEKIYQYL